jgi:4-diphosphocytidyl-2-C-methyl-D-erythritol kinase
LRLNGERWAVLVNPGFPVETRWAYEQLAARRGTPTPLSKAHEALRAREVCRWDDVIPLMENDFESALAPMHPVFGELKAALLRVGAQAALLSGSGSAVFGLFTDEAMAQHAMERLKASGHTILAVQAGTLLTVASARGDDPIVSSVARLG